MSVARLAAATAALIDAPGGTAFTASWTAVCTSAIARIAGGVPSLDSVTISPALIFQSVMTSALALSTTPQSNEAATQMRVACFILISFELKVLSVGKEVVVGRVRNVRGRACRFTSTVARR